MPIDPIEHNTDFEISPTKKERTSSRNKTRNLIWDIAKIFLLLVLIVFLVICFMKLVDHQNSNDEVSNIVSNVISTPAPPPVPSETPDSVEVIVKDAGEDIEKEEPPFLHETERTAFLDDEFPSKYVYLIDAQTGEVLAEKNSYTFMNPASMTKVLTLLVAVENITDTDGTFTMTREISEYCFVNECSVVGYIVGESVPIEELFYGCILSSGADASLALAEIAAGSHDEFVKLMNKKAEELELSEAAHFTNCVGIYDKEHGCTSADMALIMKAALENEKCRQVLCTKVYYSVATSEHPEGQVLSNWFVRSLEDQNNGDVKVLGGKRGYVPQSGACAVSYGETDNGKSFICVTGRSYNQKQAIYDHASLYKKYCIS